ncbi:MAG: response regulator [Clostridiales bacterium]|nr:response regulator [Clostridiales bacterium]
MKKREPEISSNDRLIEILLDCVDDVFLILDKKYNVEYVSPNVERILGVSVKDVMKNVSNLGSAKYMDDKEITYKTLSEIAVGSSVTHIVGREHKRNKEMHYFSETVYHSEIDRENKYFVIISDRTKELLAKQSLEEALAIANIANRSKSTFLANMSHDIRTPMNTIVGLCTLLQRDVDDKAKFNDHVKQIMLTSRHLLTLINDILDMSKIESGEATLNVSEINVIDLIKEIDGNMAPQAKAKKQSFKTTVAVKSEKFLGDKMRIKRIMTNILSNAIKYTPEGGQIEFTVQQMSRPSHKHIYLQFIVKDNGVGMSEQFVKKIFEPYSREISSNSDSHGTGLGMAVAKNLIDLMGGTISIESKEGEGSTFAVGFKFPVSKINDSNFWQEQGVARVLVIGDNNINNNSITWAMRKTEVNITFAKSVKAAVASMDKAWGNGKGYNIVIYDWDDNEQACLDEIKELRENIPEYVPLVILGDCEWSEIGEKATEAGVDALLAKPFSVALFKECVTNLKMDVREGLVPKAEKSALADMKFLAAEDNELNAMVLNELLNMVGATCVVKPNGKEVVEEFEHSLPGSYDCILMDIQMPVMDGYEATRAIRASERPEGRDIPIIAMTANAFAEDVKSSLDAGMNAYILKPIDMNKLEETIISHKKNRD